MNQHQLFSFHNESKFIIFVGAVVFDRFRKCNTFRRGHPTSSSTRRRSAEEYVNFIYEGLDGGSGIHCSLKKLAHYSSL